MRLCAIKVLRYFYKTLHRNFESFVMYLQNVLSTYDECLHSHTQRPAPPAELAVVSNIYSKVQCPPLPLATDEVQNSEAGNSKCLRGVPRLALAPSPLPLVAIVALCPRTSICRLRPSLRLRPRPSLLRRSSHRRSHCRVPPLTERERRECGHHHHHGASVRQSVFSPLKLHPVDLVVEWWTLESLNWRIGLSCCSRRQCLSRAGAFNDDDVSQRI